jgi:hypothetical protein
VRLGFRHSPRNGGGCLAVLLAETKPLDKRYLILPPLKEQQPQVLKAHLTRDLDKHQWLFRANYTIHFGLGRPAFSTSTRLAS